MKTRSPEEVLREGARLLRPMFRPHGFEFRIHRTGRSSGGDFAAGWFAAENKRLELKFRHDLRGVVYHVGDRSLSHRDYMRKLGVESEVAYPGFSDDPMDGFRHLGSDLARFGRNFIRGDGSEVARFGESRADRPSPTESKGLTRRQRRELWILAVLVWIGASGLIIYVSAVGYFGAAGMADWPPELIDDGGLIDYWKWLFWGSVANALGVPLYVLGARYVLMKARRRRRRG